MAEPPTPDPDISDNQASASAPVQARSDRSPWNWLLILPILVPLTTPLFNHDDPRLLGFPVFYWLQLAFILLGVTTTTIVYRMTGGGASR
ncbi:DUF3311 domain-containing protein [Catenuloplanes indicus]|uniref:DUF3311 domain-containing protein n=1 Tax=Catenuloplanes indicus TaxID=137267 RepID=A0AAE3VXY0_9ACTN|nr:DUF3311 domain-containing protein [Catenuloplanes indicus]MDQ0366053.1 hypothetical protein [Catenuloplanes indicus]